MDLQETIRWIAPEGGSNDPLERALNELSSSLILRLVDMGFGYSENGTYEENNLSPLDDQVLGQAYNAAESESDYETEGGADHDESNTSGQDATVGESTRADTLDVNIETSVSSQDPENGKQLSKASLQRNVLRTVRDALFNDPYIIETAEAFGFPEDEWITEGKSGRLIFYLKAPLFDDWLKRHSESIGAKFTPRSKPYAYSTDIKASSNQSRKDKAGQIKGRYFCHRRSRMYEIKNRVKGGKTGKPRQRLPSIRCECQSSFNAIFRPKDTSDGKPGDTYRIEYHFRHNHALGSADKIGTLRLVQATRQRIKAMLLRGMSINTILKQLTRDHARLTLIMQEKRSLVFSREVHVTHEDVSNVLNVIMAKDPIKDDNDTTSTKLWMEELARDGYFTFYDKEGDRYHGFSSPWQLNQLQKWGDVLCLDGAHHVCRRDTYLYTIVVKNRELGFGIPVAFFLTKTRKWELLREWLRHLKTTMDKLCPEPYFPTVVVTDQGQNEVNALLGAFEFGTRVFFCAWHVLRAWERSFTTANLGMENAPPIQQTNRKERIRKQLHDILYAPTEEEVNALIQKFRIDWQDIAPKLLHHLDRDYFGLEADKKGWLFCHHQQGSHGFLHVNNYIDQWHDIVRKQFSKNKLQRRLDSVINTLVQEVVPNLQRTCIRSMVQIGRMYPWRRTALLSKIAAINHFERTQMLNPGNTLLSLSTDGGMALKVQSFTRPDAHYNVNVNWDSGVAGQFIDCTCADFTSAAMACKHIALAAIVYPNIVFCFKSHLGPGTSALLTRELITIDEQSSAYFSGASIQLDSASSRSQLRPHRQLERIVGTTNPGALTDAQLIDHFAQTIHDYSNAVGETRNMTDKEEVVTAMKRTIELLQEHLPVRTAYSLINNKRPKQ